MASHLLIHAATVVVVAVCAIGAVEYSSQECSSQYYYYSTKHTACINKKTTPNGRVDWTSMTDADRKLIVAAHNGYRGSVHLHNGGTRATNMLPMTYDRELENLAQLWAARCLFAHDEPDNRYIPGKYAVGQNLAVGSGNWATTLKLWHSEVKDFVHGTIPENPGAVGHYTQMVWAETSRVGCGVQVCNGTSPLFVCNYGPSGNILNRLAKPYKTGDVKEDCPLMYNQTSGLCECPQSLCYNGGEVDTKSCTCRCPMTSWLHPDNCAMRCSRAKDLPMCPRWGKSYCTRYSNVKIQYCPYMCNVCREEGRLPPPPVPTVLPMTRALPFSASTSQQTSPSHTTKSSVSGRLTFCKKEEPALCGQPNTKTGYLPKSVCLDGSTATICPAMCGLCSARACRDYYETSYNLGESWINMYGRFTCTSAGVRFERGCQTEDRKDIVYLGSTRIIEHENLTYSCQCDIEDDLQRLHCVPVEPGEPEKPEVKLCERIEGARCGLPVARGRYWLKSHCKLRIVRAICPAMCRQCSARKCRRYSNVVVDIGVESRDDKNSMFVCTAHGWAIGPTIKIDPANHSSIASTSFVSVIRQRYTVRRLPSAAKATSTTLTPTTNATTITPATASTARPTTASTARPTTASTARPKIADNIAELWKQALEDTYAHDYLEDDLDSDVPGSILTSIVDNDIPKDSIIVKTISIDIGSGSIQEFDDEDGSLASKVVDADVSATIDHSVTSTSTIASTIVATTATPVTSSRTTARATTIPTSPTKRSTAAPTTTPITTTGSWSTTRTEKPSRADRSRTVLKANHELANTLFPNKSVSCQMADQAYCNQPLPGNSTLTFSPENCQLNPLVCPGLCGLCKVVNCQDYSRQVYSVGDSWHSLYARMNCTATGVVSTRGCYYELLRTFIAAGETLYREDGFLTHNCTCDVVFKERMWSHDLRCSKTVSLKQKITVAPTGGFCAKPDDYRCTDPYYSPSDCSLLSVATLCRAMCGKCTVNQCTDAVGTTHSIGESWITSLGKVVCTEKGLKTIRGCRLARLNAFIEVNGNYSYRAYGVTYTCLCERVSEYRYQLTCSGQRRRTYIAVSTIPPPRFDLTTPEPAPFPWFKSPCRRMDNPKCGQQAAEFWKVEMCTSSSKGWRTFMRRMCPGLCGFCNGSQCRGYDGKAYKIGDFWISNGVIHTCSSRGIKIS